LIAQAATSFVLEGEGVILRRDGVSDFDALHDRRRAWKVQLLAFDLLELNGEDLRADALERRKAGLANVLRRSQAGIQLTEHLEAPGHVVFRLRLRARLGAHCVEAARHAV
jgi:bifunctional non-homologous end joining protein LigD